MIPGIVAGGGTALATGPADELYNRVVSLLYFQGPNGSTVFTDETGRTWSASGSAQLAASAGVFGGSALSLDGSSYIQSPDTSDVSLGGDDWTIDCHVRFAGDPGTGLQTFVSKWEATGNQRGWGVGINNNTLRLLYSTNGANATILSTAWNPEGDVWYAVSVVRRSATIYFFVDGALLGTANIGTAVIFDSTAPLQIGTQSLGADGNFSGLIGQVRITNAAREVSAFTSPTALYPNRHGDPHFANVVSLTHWDGTDGATTFVDQIDGKTWTTGAGAVQLSTTDPRFGSAALKFPGTSGNRVDSNSHEDFGWGTGDFTIELWFRVPTLGTTMLFDQRTALSQPRSTLFYQSGSLHYFVSGSARITAAGALANNTWQHVAVSRVSGQTRLFIMGTQVGSTYNDTTNYTQERLRLGAAGDSPTFGFHDGSYDEMRITKGVGRYFRNFVPLPVPFANAA